LQVIIQVIIPLILMAYCCDKRAKLELSFCVLL